MTLPRNGPWELPIAGFEVLHITFGFGIQIVADGDEGRSAAIELEGAFEFCEPGGARRKLSAAHDSWEELAAVFSLRRDRVEAARVSEEALLDVRFCSGRQLEAGPDPHYEGWQASGPGFRLIAVPGVPGHVAQFAGDSATEPFRAS